MSGRQEDPAREAPLRIGISTRALFDLEEEHAVFIDQGADAYDALQLARENTPLAKGAGFGVVERLLALNPPGEPVLVEAVLISRSPPALAVRIFAAIEEHGLAIRTGSFTGGRPVASLVAAWEVDLFLSNDHEDVAAALLGGAAAARLEKSLAFADAFRMLSNRTGIPRPRRCRRR